MSVNGCMQAVPHMQMLRKEPLCPGFEWMHAGRSTQIDVVEGAHVAESQINECKLNVLHGEMWFSRDYVPGTRWMCAKPSSMQWLLQTRMSQSFTGGDVVIGILVLLVSTYPRHPTT